LFCGAGNLRTGAIPAAIDFEAPSSVVGSYVENAADLTAGNGVVHTIYGFLIP
jgi:hypothetical protein